jgi:hypothetical protein
MFDFAVVGLFEDGNVGGFCCFEAYFEEGIPKPFLKKSSQNSHYTLIINYQDSAAIAFQFNILICKFKKYKQIYLQGVKNDQKET